MHSRCGRTLWWSSDVSQRVGKDRPRGLDVIRNLLTGCISQEMTMVTRRKHEVEIMAPGSLSLCSRMFGRLFYVYPVMIMLLKYCPMHTGCDLPSVKFAFWVTCISRAWCVALTDQDVHHTPLLSGCKGSMQTTVNNRATSITISRHHQPSLSARLWRHAAEPGSGTSGSRNRNHHVVDHGGRAPSTQGGFIRISEG
jgi:hypothetical protein